MRRFPAVAAAVLLLSAPSILHAQFLPGPNPITGTVGAQTLTGGTGTVAAGGEIRVASGGTVALSMSGTSTLINNGTIQTLGTGRAIDSNSGVANLTVTNAGLISSVSSDAFRVNIDSAVALTNSGTIRVTNGGQAIDWAAISTRSNSLINLATGVITAVGEDAVRPGANGVVMNAGTIAATPIVTGGSSSGSDGIDVRTLSGIRVTNSGTITGRHGIATDGSNAGPSTITVTNEAGGTIAALNGSGLNIDGVSASVTANVTNRAGATIKGGVLAATTDGDGDGIDVDGVLTLDNGGDILGLGAKGLNDGQPNNAQAVSIGGGTIVNRATGRIIGSTLAADAPNGDTTRAGEGILADNSSGGNSVAVTTVTNDGLIQGKTGAAIRFVSNFSDSVTNNAGGVIQGAGTGAAIQTGNGANTVVNAGTIIGDNGRAIDLQGGDDSLVIRGGSARIVGDISGGAGTNTLTLDVDGGFSYSGSISDFSLVGVVSGVTTLSGASAYIGTTRITGGTLILDGAGRLASGGSLDMNGGTLGLVNAGGPNGQTFASLSLTGDSIIDLGGSSLTFGDLGNVGGTLTILGYDPSLSPNFAIRFLGDRTRDANFLGLVGFTTVDGRGASYSFDGLFTNIRAVPEPSSILAFCLAATGFYLVVGRNRRSCNRRQSC